MCLTSISCGYNTRALTCQACLYCWWYTGTRSKQDSSHAVTHMCVYGSAPAPFSLPKGAPASALRLCRAASAPCAARGAGSGLPPAARRRPLGACSICSVARAGGGAPPSSRPRSPPSAILRCRRRACSPGPGFRTLRCGRTEACIRVDWALLPPVWMADAAQSCLPRACLGSLAPKHGAREPVLVRGGAPLQRGRAAVKEPRQGSRTMRCWNSWYLPRILSTGCASLHGVPHSGYAGLPPSLSSQRWMIRVHKFTSRQEAGRLYGCSGPGRRHRLPCWHAQSPPICRPKSFDTLASPAVAHRLSRHSDPYFWLAHTVTPLHGHQSTRRGCQANPSWVANP